MTTIPLVPGRLWALRSHYGYTQQAFAAAAGIVQSAVSTAEHTHTVTPRTLTSIVQVAAPTYGVDYLTVGTPPDRQTIAVTTPTMGTRPGKQVRGQVSAAGWDHWYLETLTGWAAPPRPVQVMSRLIRQALGGPVDEVLAGARRVGQASRAGESVVALCWRVLGVRWAYTWTPGVGGTIVHDRTGRVLVLLDPASARPVGLQAAMGVGWYFGVGPEGKRRYQTACRFAEALIQHSRGQDDAGGQTPGGQRLQAVYGAAYPGQVAKVTGLPEWLVRHATGVAGAGPLAPVVPSCP